MNSVSLPSAIDIEQALATAAAFVSNGQLAAAEEIYQRILAEAPDSHLVLHALSLLKYQAGHLLAALELAVKAVALAPATGIYQCDLCTILRRVGKLDKAVVAGRHAVELLPDDAQAHYEYAMVLADTRQVGEAILNYARALELNPQHDLAWNNMGVLLEQIDEKPSAEYAYSMAATMNPQNEVAHNNLGALCARQGKLETARECFAQAIAISPDYLAAHFNLSTLKTYQADDPHLSTLEGLKLVENTLPVMDRIQLNFTLGKAREDIGSFDGAFAAYAQGNRQYFKQYPYDELLANVLHNNVKSVFTHEFFRRHPQRIHRDLAKTPIFIIGMPRSGTTLVEQILSSHPSVFGAGEIMDLSEVIDAAPGLSKGQRFTDLCTHASEDEFAALGDAYASRLQQLAPEHPYVTDKMTGNYLYIGIIYKMLPNAKIIHVMRDPMDSCFSCYSHHFAGSMNFAYDLKTLGRYYVRYIELMKHWHAVLPSQTVLNVRYEDVVEDVESQVRRMLEFVGLPWDAACLDFHQSQRRVKTASIAQVNKPIYKTSVARWQRFGAHLDPLLAIVKNYRK